MPKMARIIPLVGRRACRLIACCLLTLLLIIAAFPASAARDFLGDWAYSISWPDHFIGFHLHVYRDGDQGLARMANDGHMTMDRMNLRVDVEANTARFYFVSHYDEHLIDIHKPGDLLFELIHTPRATMTRWKEFNPTDGERCVCFRRE